jgi:hypothetical protein
MDAIERMPRISLESAAAAVNTYGPLIKKNGSVLYGLLCEDIADDPELLEMVSHGLASFPVVHLFVAVQFLLLRDPNDPLARFYAALTENPEPPEGVFPDFKRYCLQHRAEILELMRTRTIQATFTERCQVITPLASYIADLAGEPLNIIEIGCSAGLLLSFDKYAYDVKGGARIGPQNAPLTMAIDAPGAPPIHMPRIGRRIGLDLRPVDAKSKEERLWLMAQLTPDERTRQRQLAAALDTVAQTDIEFHRGDALDFVPLLVAECSGPLLIYHSNCLIYWTPEGKAQLDAQLREGSRGRDIYRLGVEPDIERAKRGQSGIEIMFTRYRDGEAESRLLAEASNDSAIVTWVS